MKKSAKILVIAALVVSAVVMTSCSNIMSLFGAKPSGSYVHETRNTKGELTAKDVYTFTGNRFKDEGYSKLLAGNWDEPWITITGTVSVDGDTAYLTEENTGLNVQIVITTTDKWKSFKDKSGNKYTKKGL